MDTEDQAYHSGLTFAENASIGSVLKDSEMTAGSPSRKEMNKLFMENQTTSEAHDPRVGSIKLTEGRVGGSSRAMQALTPTSRLAGQLDSITIVRRTVGEGVKFSSIESPSSDYPSGNFSSLTESDRGYASMTSMPSFGKTFENDCPATTSQLQPLPQSSSSEFGGINACMGDRQVRVDGGMDASKCPKFIPAMVEEMNTASEPMMGGRERERNSSSPSHEPPILSLSEGGSVVCGESPSTVPAIGENIEVMTDAYSSGLVSLISEQESGGGVLSKRSAGGLLEAEEPSRKNPRLNPEHPSGNFIN